MRKTILALSAIAGAAVFATSASAQPQNYPEPYGPTAAVGAGVVTGTVVGLGFSEGWWGSAPASLGTVAGASAVGLVAGIGTVALIDSVTRPCHGFRILVDSEAECAARFAPPVQQVERRVERRRYRR